MREKLVFEKELKKIAHARRDCAGFRGKQRGGRLDDSLQGAGDAFKLGHYGGVDSRGRSTFDLYGALADVALGEAREAGPDLCRLGRKAGMFGGRDANGDGLRAGR